MEIECADHQIVYQIGVCLEWLLCVCCCGDFVIDFEVLRTKALSLWGFDLIALIVLFVTDSKRVDLTVGIDKECVVPTLRYGQ